ncbi:THAP domain-containing protein 5 [Bagarius yarrelli]|uniref:THAP domain-containing protein 5 n=1 Tax=Bagarius yarrelli TaxID=175774 RepID=A0A556UZ96_BAGYA|nr:THAP domain-containing protein 5 [Bagarius yarrelli]
MNLSIDGRIEGFLLIADPFNIQYKMSSCEACGNTETPGVTLHSFPQEEEQLQHWISSMGKDSGWRPSESALLCSDHFTSDCFHTSGHLHSSAVPSVCQTTEETSAQSAESSEHTMCEGCEKQLQLIEKSYKLKLLSAQLKAKKYEKELNEQAHKVTKLQRKVIVLQTAMKVMSMKKLKCTNKISESSSKKHDVKLS